MFPMGVVLLRTEKTSWRRHTCAVHPVLKETSGAASIVSSTVETAAQISVSES